tara:strand:+ start:1489 stop:2298 length:810 start_codon:yes stop_codon:yes gene_type:complete
MEWIDSHCHLDGYLRQGKLEAVLDRAAKANVTQMIAIGTELDDWTINHDLSLQYSQRISYTVGLHPCHVTESWDQHVNALEAYFDRKHKPVALGEIGLDYFHLPKNPEDAEGIKRFQQSAFERQLAIAKRLGCPVVIHSRDAYDDTIETIDASGVDWNKIVVHCFSYSSEQIKVINKRGGRASFTGIVTYKNAPKVQKAVIEQGSDVLMIETDSPYLSPEPHRGKTNEPAYVAEIGKKCALLLDEPPMELSQKLAENTRKFFSLSVPHE